MKINKIPLDSAFFFVGASAAGKTTLAKLFKDFLDQNGYSTFLCDGNDMAEYKVLDSFSGFDIESRAKRGKQLTNLINWIKKQNIIIIASVIGQPVSSLDYYRKHISNYNEIYLKCSIEACIKRDNKNIYLGNDSNVVGKDIKFQDPKNFDIILDSQNNTPEKLLSQLIANINKR